MVDTKQKIQVFQNEEFGELTTIIINGDVWFIGKEIATALGYEKPNNSVNKFVDNSDKRYFKKSEIKTLLPQNRVLEIPNRGLTCINESGLYSLILSSKLPQAKQFKHWVTSEVLPAIRKYGSYSVAGNSTEISIAAVEKALYNPDFIINLATRLKEAEQRNTELTATNAALSDKANTWDFSSIINALVRTYANKQCRGNFSYAFGIFYKQVQYKLHINLKHRRTTKGKETDTLISFFKKSEYPLAIKVATAMCEEAGLDTGKIINEVNARNADDDVRYSLTAKGLAYFDKIKTEKMEA